MKIILVSTLVAISLLAVTPALAADSGWVSAIIGGPLIPSGCTESNSGGSQVDQCGLNEILQVVINFSTLLLALTGSAALLMFTYGGALWILAAGRQEWIQKGKAAIIAAAVGVFIILGAYLIVNLTILALTDGEVGGKATIFQGVNPFEAPQGPQGEVEEGFDFNF